MGLVEQRLSHRLKLLHRWTGVKKAPEPGNSHRIAGTDFLVRLASVWRLLSLPLDRAQMIPEYTGQGWGRVKPSAPFTGCGREITTVSS